jgi:hypothetical protein
MIAAAIPDRGVGIHTFAQLMYAPNLSGSFEFSLACMRSNVTRVVDYRLLRCDAKLVLPSPVFGINNASMFVTDPNGAVFYKQYTNCQLRLRQLL